MNSYFFDGCNAKYGLYDVINNRFVIVAYDLEILTRCILLLNSKTNLYAVYLPSAPNHESVMIDNQCCHNWGLDNIEAADLFKECKNSAQLLIDPVPALLRLKPVSNPPPPTDIEQELQKFAFLAHFVAQHWHDNSNWIYRDYYDFVNWPEPFLEAKELERSMYHAIYQAQEYSIELARVQELMN
jgi:hypothetical protein